jgi:hypothetical protein
MDDTDIGSIHGHVKSLAQKIIELDTLRATLTEASTKRDELMRAQGITIVNMKIQLSGGRLIELIVDYDEDKDAMNDLFPLIVTMLTNRAHDCIQEIERIAADIAN